jgi:hypothetical protein
LQILFHIHISNTDALEKNYPDQATIHNTVKIIKIL